MIKHTLWIQNENVRLKIIEGQLRIFREEILLGQTPLEDLGMVLLDHPSILLSADCLGRMAEAGACVVTCDTKKVPNGLLLPFFFPNQKGGQRLKLQMGASVPLQKRVWQKVIRAKIFNQRANLPPGAVANRLLKMAKELKSGDPTNIEAQAGRLYWENFFPALPAPFAPFRRKREGLPPNGLLNYGYAILRAMIARCLVLAGLHPSLGIKHSAEVNPFALADDWLEPFRPFVDRRVAQLVEEGQFEPNPETKKLLLSLLPMPVEFDSEQSPLQISAQKSVHTLVKALEKFQESRTKALSPEKIQEMIRLIKFPSLPPLKGAVDE